MRAIAICTVRCTFWKARTSIWRTRSREMSNSTARSSSVIGSSASWRASKMRRSRSLSTESASERLLAVVRFLVLDEPRLLIGDLVDEPVLPFAGIAVVADWRVERHVAAKATVHVDHVLL